MLEVVFGDSIAGSMSIAMHHNGHNIGAASVALLHSDGSTLSGAARKKQQQEAEARERRNWASATLLQGSRRDIICLPLALSIGNISEREIGTQRKSALSLLMGVYPAMAAHVVAEMMETAQNSLAVLLERAKAGEPIRVWSSKNPDEACGLYWLTEQLRPLGLEHVSVTLVCLPEFIEQDNGTMVQGSGWGEMAPHLLGKMAARGKQLSAPFLRFMAQQWQQLQNENAMLRALVNNRLVSVPESFYDAFILRELDAQNAEFMEAQWIGSVLGKYAFGISDGWVAFRIAQWIQSGLLEPVTQAEHDAPTYHRILRKRK